MSGSKNTNTVLNLIVITLIAIIIVSTVIGLYAWAKYTSSINGNATAQVAKWNFNLKDGTATIDGKERVLLALTRTDDYTQVVEGKVAPGTYGELPIIIDTTGTEVDLTYDLVVTIENCPKNMVFTPQTPASTTITREGLGTPENPRMATITIHKYVPHTKVGEHDETIKWDWPYETTTGEGVSANDKIDTNDAGKDIMVTISVVGTQVQPEENTPVTTLFAKFYDDGTLVLSSTDEMEYEGTVVEDYEDVYDYTGSVPKWNDNTRNITNVIIEKRIQPKITSQWFAGCSQLKDIDLSNLDTSNVTDMNAMFASSGLTSLDLRGLDTSSVTNMGSMFAACSQLTNVNLSGLDANGVMNMIGMFGGCSKLTNVNLSGFNANSVTNMNSMFSGCSGLTSLDLSGFNANSVTNMNGLFSGCSGLTSLDLSGFNTSSVTVMGGMFYGCSGLTTIYSSDSFNTENVSDSRNMFQGCSNLKGGNGTTYSSSKIDKEYARIDTAETPGYFTKK